MSSSMLVTRSLSAVVAMTPSGGIGLNGKLPWDELTPKVKLSNDLLYFKNTTMETKHPNSINCVIMGNYMFYILIY